MLRLPSVALVAEGVLLSSCAIGAPEEPKITLPFSVIVGLFFSAGSGL